MLWDLGVVARPQYVAEGRLASRVGLGKQMRLDRSRGGRRLTGVLYSVLSHGTNLRGLKPLAFTRRGG